MKSFEVLYGVLRPFLLPLHYQVHSELKALVKEFDKSQLPKLLDVGGRKSHYTIGLQAQVTITDLLRETHLQSSLHLGINDQTVHQTLKRRSNVEQVIIDDMQETSLSQNQYDIVVAIEVLEHVERDYDFIDNVHKVLKPGGVFLMTTPNGDYLTVISNPDHKRHYKRSQLHEILNVCFDSVEVYYAVKGGRFHTWGLRSWSVRRPIGTLLSGLGNVISRWQSFRPNIKEQSSGTHHLIAIARKSAE